ncbi:unnamed protein product [Somion occarium]|uniref:Uncharacterized protein n=1 Tax=Somion occarium TaxID=3059160 RepID=A0ABP1D9U7_9APHY
MGYEILDIKGNVQEDVRVRAPLFKISTWKEVLAQGVFSGFLRGVDQVRPGSCFQSYTRPPPTPVLSGRKGGLHYPPYGSRSVPTVCSTVPDSRFVVRVGDALNMCLRQSEPLRCLVRFLAFLFFSQSPAKTRLLELVLRFVSLLFFATVRLEKLLVSISIATICGPIELVPLYPFLPLAMLSAWNSTIVLSDSSPPPVIVATPTGCPNRDSFSSVMAMFGVESMVTLGGSFYRSKLAGRLKSRVCEV